MSFSDYLFRAWFSAPASARHAAPAAYATRRAHQRGRPAVLFALAALVVALALSPMQATESATVPATTMTRPLVESSHSPGDPVRLLMIGDSMSVGDFGES